MTVARPRHHSPRCHLTRFSCTVAVKGATLVLLLSVSAAGVGAAGAGGSSPAAAKKAFPYRYTLTDAKIGHWAAVLRSVVAHRQPKASSPAVTRMPSAGGAPRRF